MFDVIQNFSTALAAEGKSKNTIKNYLVAVRQLLRVHILPNAADAGTIKQLLAYAKKAKVNPRGLKLFISNLNKKTSTLKNLKK